MVEVTSLDTIRKGNVVVDFYTSTCAPCRALTPVMEEISSEYKNTLVAKVEVTQNPDISQMFGVMTVPTVIFMTDCKVNHVVRGFSGKDSYKTLAKQYCTR